MTTSRDHTVQRLSAERSGRRPQAAKHKIRTACATRLIQRGHLLRPPQVYAPPRALRVNRIVPGKGACPRELQRPDCAKTFRGCTIYSLLPTITTILDCIWQNEPKRDLLKFISYQRILSKEIFVLTRTTIRSKHQILILKGEHHTAPAAADIFACANQASGPCRRQEAGCLISLFAAATW